MAGKRSSRSSTPKYPRSARVSTTLQEIIADELVRIDDERLTFVTVTGIDVDPELNRAIVFFDSLGGEEGDAEIIEAFADHRVRLQSAIARQIRAKKTPILDFRPDLAIRSAERIDDILRADSARRAREAGEQQAGSTEPGSTEAGSTEAGSTETGSTEQTG
jgi:ribosome-binding factor A